MFGKKDQNQEQENEPKKRGFMTRSLIPSVAAQQDKQDAENAVIKQSQDEIKERDKALYARTNEYKAQWVKNGIIQFKNERIAILKRQVGAQVEFIIAYDDLTKEGYMLRAIDEGKTADAGGMTGGASSYYYFQKLPMSIT